MLISPQHTVSLFFGAALLAASAGHAELAITNGDFETNTRQTMAVDGWFSTNAEPANPTNEWWRSTWVGPTVSPNGTPVLGLSFHDGLTNWAYQEVGTNFGGLSSLTVQFDLGSFVDAGEPRNFAVEFSLYQSDGTFTGADNTDVQGSPGATQIDSVTSEFVTLEPGAFATDRTVILDLSTADTTGALYLRMQNVGGSAGAPFIAVDNIALITDPGEIDTIP